MELQALLNAIPVEDGPLLFLTGAGISAESGIPTFRGEDGYWRVDGRNYRPQEMATNAAFMQMPRDVWTWYLYRRAVCRAAGPNASHVALADLERDLVAKGRGDSFLLVTQNVDGLHLLAGNSLARTYQIHGNIDYLRCVKECGPPTPIPSEVSVAPERESLEGGQDALTDAMWEQLVCPRCGARARPHVLWFDESYDEEKFRFESSIRAANEACAVVIVGTSGATNLPMHIGAIAANRGAPLLVINKDENPFSEMLSRGARGAFLRGTAGEFVPQLTTFFASRYASP